MYLDENYVIIYDVDVQIHFIRFVCVSLMHFQFCNEFELNRNCLKFLALNWKHFKYPFRALICSLLGIAMVLMIEALSVYYVMCFATVLDIVNNFIKLKILASFDDFFVEPFKNSSMRSFMGIKVEI